MRRVDAIEGIAGDAVVPSAVASLEFLLYAGHEAGDHVLLTGRVVAPCHSPGSRSPLFHHGRCATLA